MARPEEDNARSNAFGATMMLVLVSLVLLVVEVNVTNLLLARAVTRRREFKSYLRIPDPGDAAVPELYRRNRAMNATEVLNPHPHDVGSALGSRGTRRQQ